jgi:hypothetical protein
MSCHQTAGQNHNIKVAVVVVVVVCGFRDASASKAICAYLQLEGIKILECMHYLQAKCMK